MPYTKTTWSDRVVQKPLTYTIQNNGDGTSTLVPAEGTVSNTGTPLSASNLNNLETQYDKAMADVASTYQRLVNPTTTAETGFCGIGGTAAVVGTGNLVGVGVNFRVKRSAAPTSITFTATSSNASIATPPPQITADGFWLAVQNGGGAIGTYYYWRGTYTTVN